MVSAGAFPCGSKCTSGFHPYGLDCGEVARIGLVHAGKSDLSERMIAIYADYKKAAGEPMTIKSLGEYSAEELLAELGMRTGAHAAKLVDRLHEPRGLTAAAEHAFRSAEVGVPAAAPPGPIKLDLGCGKNKKPGFLGVDVLKFEGVDVECHLGLSRWPWADGSVEEVHASHFVEHLTAGQRIWFANELFRVLKPGGTATIITPHWNSPRAYGDLTHAWPPVSEWWFLYLSKSWRDVNAPHNTDYTCDFPQPVIGYSPNMGLCAGRNQEYVQHMVTTARGGADDLCATLQKPLGAK